MAKVIPKKELKKEIWDFLKKLDQEVEDDLLVVQVEEGKVVVQSLKKWLEERKKKKS